MSDGALLQEELDKLMGKRSVKQKEFILKEIKLLQCGNKEDEFYIKGIAALLHGKNCSKKPSAAKKKVVKAAVKGLS